MININDLILIDIRHIPEYACIKATICYGDTAFILRKVYMVGNLYFNPDSTLEELRDLRSRFKRVPIKGENDNQMPIMCTPDELFGSGHLLADLCLILDSDISIKAYVSTAEN